jgi:hypothetical protein
LVVLSITVLGVLAMPMPKTGSASPSPSAAPPLLSAQVVVGAFSEASPVPSAFWGVNIAATHRFDSADAAAVSATPATYLRFPGGILGEEYNYTSGMLTGDNGTQTASDTSTAEFVASCELMNCHAILQLPAEIDRPATAAYYAAYVVHTLKFQPTYWEIGNDPSGWDHYNVSWSNWGTEGGGNTTPLPFANLVHAYIAAVLKVDPAGQFLALGAGLGGKNYAKPWVEDLAEVDGTELAGISVHSYIEGGPSSPTDAQLFANLNGFYSLPAQVTADRSYIEEACPSCTNLGIFVSEINAAEDDGYMQLLPSFAGTLYLAAETAQGLALQAANLDWFAYDSHYPGSWSVGTGAWQMQYYLFSDLLTHLKTETLPTTITGDPSLYGVATYDSTGLALLLVNVNTTGSVQLNLTSAQFSATAGLTQYLWVDGTPLPVESQLSAGASIVLPPLSTEVLVGTGAVPTDKFPVEFAESGLPPGATWSVTVNDTVHTTTQSTIGFSKANGTYSFTIQSPLGYVAAPVNGTFTVSGSPVLVPVAFTSTPALDFAVTFTENGLPAGTQWSVAVNGSSIGTTSSTLAFFETNGSYEFSVGNVPGYAPTPASGSIQLQGSAVNVNLTFVPTTSTYVATFSESGLAPGLSWSVSVGGTMASAVSPGPVLITLTNGSHVFTVGQVSGYSASPVQGWVTIQGAGSTVAITYVPVISESPNRILAVEGGVMNSNGSAVPDIGVSLVFRGGASPTEWLNLTTNSSGRFAATGLNLTGNLSTVEVDSSSYQVTLMSLSWPAADAVNVTVFLKTLPSVIPPGPSSPPPVVLVILGLGGVAATLIGAVVRAARQDRKMARYRAYFANPPR